MILLSGEIQRKNDELIWRRTNQIIIINFLDYNIILLNYNFKRSDGESQVEFRELG